MLHITDTIERTLVLRAPRATVWANSFSTPDALASWFPDQIEGEFAVGDKFFLIWGDARCECVLIELIEERSLVYQWHPGVSCRLDEHPSEELTTVRFTLSDHPEGTLVEMVESGFLNIPDSRRTFGFSENTQGWGSELPKLEAQYDA